MRATSMLNVRVQVSCYIKVYACATGIIKQVLILFLK